MLLIQRIVANWTKRSRGGEQAILRNSVPEALVVPEFEPSEGRYVVHDVRFSERSNFRAHSELAYRDLKPSLTIAPLHLNWSRSALSVRFMWTYHEVGAPERESHGAFRLCAGQWGRFRCNGRFGAETTRGQEWLYRKSVINIAIGNTIARDVFVASAPEVDHDRLAQLR